MASFNSLPSELLQLMCTFMNPNDIFELCMVNRFFFECGYPNLFYQVKLTSNRRLESFLTLLEEDKWNAQSYAPRIESLKFLSTRLSLSDIDCIQIYCQNIKHLEFDRFAWWSPFSQQYTGYNQQPSVTPSIFDMLDHFLKFYTQLDSLSMDLGGTSRHSHLMPRIIFPFTRHLTRLTLSDMCNGFSMLELDGLHNNSPQLEHLSLSGCAMFTSRRNITTVQRIHTLRSLELHFNVGWDYHHDWLWYFAKKYEGLTSLICECTTTTSRYYSRHTNQLPSYQLFAQQHMSTLNHLEFINLVFDNDLYLTLFHANDFSSHNDNNQQLITTTTTSSTTAPTIGLTSARFSSTTDIMDDVLFEAIIWYLRKTIQTLFITWTLDDLSIGEGFLLCTHLTDLTIAQPCHLFRHGTNAKLPISLILQWCPLLTRLHLIHVCITISGDSSVTNNQIQHPLKELVLASSDIPTSLLILEDHGLTNIRRMTINHCFITDLNFDENDRTSTMIYWLFPTFPASAPNSPVSIDRSISLSLHGLYFQPTATTLPKLSFDYLCLYQSDNDSHQLWSIRSPLSHKVKLVSVSHSIARRKAGQLKRKSSYSQTGEPPDYTDGEGHDISVGLLEGKTMEVHSTLTLIKLQEGNRTAYRLSGSMHLILL
ncbi:uncharacterized protein BX664DRAFT_382605 [Halteromyces radiatus]|uniref:uncharacterized protein n=1 Tax=Halteromyces radiatus TaxID=101107 RepID=UPI00221E5952|nr:uncharacterized protein BX664DRAFT_382605 [Halteromyces radiatus]KAI8100176.1 hypothetical protein BX664DRAFT_382605 [Halteromyces radiatus]